MADDVDRAKVEEMRQRDQALARQRGNRLPQHAIKTTPEGVRICAICEVAIDPRRIEKRPESALCTDCKTIEEEQQKLGAR